MMATSVSLERRDLMLVPFLLLVVFYLVTFDCLFQLPPENFTTAFTKTAPIWYLACYVGMTPKFQQNPLAQGARVGLILSSVGDMCLVWRQTLFLPGMFFFALAQVGYIYGLKSWLRRGSYPSGRYVREFTVMCVVCFLFLFTGIQSPLMAACVLGYSGLLFAMVNLSLQRHLVEGNEGSFYGVIGAASFLVSDSLIGVTKWMLTLPFSEFLIMVSYYLAQCAIAAGAVHSARAKRRE